jgi:hypothetical protein
MNEKNRLIKWKSFRVVFERCLVQILARVSVILRSSWFPQYLHGNARILSSLEHNRFFSNPLLFILIIHSTVWFCTLYVQTVS